MAITNKVEYLNQACNINKGLHNSKIFVEPAEVNGRTPRNILCKFAQRLAKRASLTVDPLYHKSNIPSSVFYWA
jgi:hypothetical protein